jgi:hypothetical protein
MANTPGNQPSDDGRTNPSGNPSQNQDQRDRARQSNTPSKQSGMDERPLGTDKDRDSESRNQGGQNPDDDMTTGQGTGRQSR